MENEDKIKTLYEMLFPYATYSGNRASTCILIERELRQLCRQETRHVLLLIAKFLRIDFTRQTSTETICDEIQKDIQKTCLSFDNDMIKASYVIGRTTGITPIETEIMSYEDRDFCQGDNSIIYQPRGRIWSREKKDELILTKQYLYIPTFKTYSIKDAERFWSDPETSEYVYLSSLRVMGTPDDIRDHFVTLGVPVADINRHIAYSYTVANYNNEFSIPYQNELADAKDVPHVELFPESTMDDIEQHVRNHLLYKPVGFINRFIAGIRTGRIPLTIDGRPTTYADVCK